MSCPDINRLIDLLGDGRPDAELEAHLEECLSCRADLQLLQEIPAVLRPEIEVPKQLVQRVMAGFPQLEDNLERRQVPAAHVVGSGVLGALTTMALLVATGSAGAGDPLSLLLFSVAVGLVASGVQVRVARRSRLGAA